ncbi:MAG: porin family protein [Phreatobacter sp.]|uniref:outer membrane protein n=1 Tax=Phreatobacter sp. TaxID=1966341 RepID=UPI001A3856C4|nr:outer membrane beta-barrel protein [Phreatobacter sp.]MBL8568974.1 porin family protein [Phreatobacter sp.]
MKKLAFAFAAIGALAGQAAAADLGVPRAPVAAAVIAPVFNWSGFYAGADAGYWAGPSYVSYPGAPIFFGSATPQGFKLGGHVGYRHQFANNFVLGLEGDLSWLGNASRETFVNSGLRVARIRGNWDGSVRATAGFAIDRALVYATGGLAFINATGCTAFGPSDLCAPNTRFGGTRAGWTVGAGLAYAVTQNVAVRAEYLYANYGGRTYSTTGVAGAQTRHKLDTHTVRLGVSYLFSTGPSAVVARY